MLRTKGCLGRRSRESSVVVSLAMVLMALVLRIFNGAFY